jgi:TolB-like protein
MKRLLVMLVAVLGVVSMAFAQVTAVPTAQQPMKVLVIPFKQIGGVGHEWVGAAIHENLIMQVAADQAIQAVEMSKPLVDNTPQDAIATAKSNGATLVVYGSFQFSGDQFRVNGQILDADDNRTLATLRATGPIIDLFKIEDTLWQQLNSALPQPPTTMPPSITYGAEQSASPQAVPYYAGNEAANSVVTQPPAYVYTTPPYDYYGYGYPYYGYPYYYGGYGYPFYYGGFGPYYYGRGWGGRFFVGRGGFRGGFHNGFRGGFGGGFRGGFGGGFHGGGMGGGFHGGGGGHGR